MQGALRFLTYALVFVVIVMLGALAGWYFFLRSRTESTVATDAARGLESQTPSFGNPAGSNSANSIGVLPTGSSGNGTSASQRLWEVDAAPVAGDAFAPQNASSTALYYVERGNGYVFSADAGQEKITRVSDTLTPKVYEAVVLPKTQAVLLRGLDDTGSVTTVYGSFATTSTDGGPVGLSETPLANGIRRIAVAPGESLFLLSTGAAGSTGTTAKADGTKPSKVFSSPLSEWEPQYGYQGLILTESAADNMPGYAYVLSKGALTPLLGPLPGLQILPNAGENALLYSESSGGTLSVFAQVGGGKSVALPIHTIVEKCVWAPGKSLIAYCAVPNAIPSAQFIDDWYQGIVHTADTWWQIDASAGTAQQLFSMPRALDVQAPHIDSSGNYIAFINGSDQSLWLFRIAQ